ncbi:MAG: Uracil glycosylase superfamily protein [Planctomycetaceae bacterium]|nr:Uracil glycosylase superfamily protein [Planctomycetaceae bacterium]
MSETVETDLRRVILQTLESWHAAGISHLTSIPVLEAPAPAPAVEAPLPVASTTEPDPAQTTTTEPTYPPESSTETTSDMAKKPAAAKPTAGLDLAAQVAAKAQTELRSGKPLSRPQRITELQVLQQKVAKCTRCTELAETRTQTVFGVGNPEARLVFVGEAPGADEDAQGEPFVGRAGQLLNKIIEAMKLQREDIYICNILRCRPPGNRLPSPEEAGHCREYLDGQLGIIQPEYIVCWGTCAAQNLLSETNTIGKLRGRFFQYGGAKVLCTYHPSYLLRNPAAKKDVWEDMKILMKEMGLPID